MCVDSTSLIVCSTSGKKVEFVDVGTRKKYEWDINESPVAKKRNVLSAILAGKAVLILLCILFLDPMFN